MGDLKKCAICKELHPISMFHNQSDRPDGLCSWCKPCKSERKKISYQKNRDKCLAKMAEYRKENPEKVRAAKKRCYKNKSDVYNARDRANYQKNRNARLEYQAQYRQENKELISARDRAYVAKRMKEDDLFRLSYSVRNRIFIALRRNNFKKSSKTVDMLGCDFEFLQLFIEEQFKPGMTWENRKAWHVDHKIPLASAKTAEEMEALCHFSNLRPMRASDNIRKGARMDYA